MRQGWFAAALAIGCGLGSLQSGPAAAADWKDARIVPADQRPWRKGANLTGAEIAGDRNQKGSLYVNHVIYAKGVQIMPHTHPDERVVTVLAGTFYQGIGETFDESKAHALPAGSVVVIPPGTPHFGFARDGDVTLQEIGIGPTATVPWPTGK